VTAPAPRAWLKHLFRIGALIVPSALAWAEAFSDPRPTELSDAVKFTLGPLWVLLAGGLFLRTVGIVWHRKRVPGASILAQIDVLTSGGAALSWLSAFAIMGAVWSGWASLAAVGLLGSGLFHVVVLLAFVAMRGADPVRGSTITRRFVPATVTEGESVVEELRFAGTRIPIGFRLFAESRVGPRWPTSRHTLDAKEAGGEVIAESDLGAAFRGEHDAEPLAVWLQDTFGICRSLRFDVAPARLTVLPRLREAEKLAFSVERGDGPHAPRPARRLPTEGLFRLREYQPGDDVRRIHWMRSLAARELIVRLPDELPPDRPHVRLVLDTFFPEATRLRCDAPSELLDSVVEVWLAVGRALAESGSRVTLVMAGVDAAGRENIGAVQHELSLRSLDRARKFGAQASWQGSVMIDALLNDDPTLVVARAFHARPQERKTRWIAVLAPRIAPDAKWPLGSNTRLPFPAGSSDNRWTRRRREADRIAQERCDHAQAIVAMHGNLARRLPGSFLASTAKDGAIHLEVLR
jgi:uncharacterized protein (DUF58 family)